MFYIFLYFFRFFNDLFFHVDLFSARSIIRLFNCTLTQTEKRIRPLTDPLKILNRLALFGLESAYDVTRSKKRKKCSKITFR